MTERELATCTTRTSYVRISSRRPDSWVSRQPTGVWPVARERGEAAVAVTLAMTGLMAVDATQALAYSCADDYTTWVYGPSGVAKADVTIYWGWSDRKDHWSGTVYDTKCDAHPAHFVIAGDVEADPVSVDSFPVVQADWHYANTDANGCGTYTTFSGSGSPAATETITIGAGNCNWRDGGCEYGLDQFVVRLSGHNHANSWYSRVSLLIHGRWLHVRGYRYPATQGHQRPRRVLVGVDHRRGSERLISVCARVRGS